MDGTQDIILSLIREGILTVDQADVIKLDWETNHRFKLPFSAFDDLRFRRFAWRYLPDELYDAGRSQFALRLLGAGDMPLERLARNAGDQLPTR